jgi:hypothetical protein
MKSNGILEKYIIMINLRNYQIDLNQNIKNNKYQNIQPKYKFQKEYKKDHQKFHNSQKIICLLSHQKIKINYPDLDREDHQDNLLKIISSSLARQNY